MAAGLLERLLADVNPQILAGTASWLGEPAANTGKAVQAAYLAILQRLGALCRDPATRGHVVDLVHHDDNDHYLLTRIAELFQGRMTTARSRLGELFLATLFGSHVADVARDVAGVSGVSRKSAQAILSSASPHALALLAPRLRAAGARAAGAIAAYVEKEPAGLAAHTPAGWDRLGVVSAAATATTAAAPGKVAAAAPGSAKSPAAPAAAPPPPARNPAPPHGARPAPAMAASEGWPWWGKLALPLVLLALLWPIWNWLRPGAGGDGTVASSVRPPAATAPAPTPARPVAETSRMPTAAATNAPIDHKAADHKTSDHKTTASDAGKAPAPPAPKQVAEAPKAAAPQAKSPAAEVTEPAKPAPKSLPGVTTYFGTDAKTVTVPAEAVINPEYAALLAKAEPAAPAAPAFKSEPGVTTYIGTDDKTVTVPAEAVMNPDYVAAAAPPKPAPSAAARACQAEVSRAATSGPIRFRTGKADLAAESEATLRRLVEAIKACPAVRVNVEGHTDNTGSSQRNQVLSRERATTVADFLAEAGIPSERITATGYGETRPVAPNDTDANKARNRRIGFTIEDLKGS